ncbi:MAG: hypothetical protein LC753_06445 [Acidobacteria bacterium]|nr:hypothetical protein [Acidobacteriota bacterium]MCA1649929.1 hypothetical protein [Acidobacteriota bacterium]
MRWSGGRPHHIVVYDLDDTGELVLSRTIRDGEPDPEWRRFSCRVEVWRTLQTLARDHGWVPAGTSPDSSQPEQSDERRAGTDTSYEPTDWAFAKLVSGADAAAVADGLERALAAGACGADDRRVDGPVFIREG